MFRRTSIFTRLLVLSAIVLLLSQGFAAWQSWTWVRASVVLSEGERVEAAAASLALGLDGTVHEALAAAWPERDAFTRWADADLSVRTLHQELLKAQESLGLTSPVYTLRVRDEARQAITDAPDQAHPDALEFLATSAEVPFWRHTYEYRPEMRATLFEGRSAHTGVYGDSHGERVSGYAPVRDREGVVVALLEVDAPLEHVLAEVWRQASRQLILAVAVFLGVLITVGSITRRLFLGIGQVEEAAARIGEGDLATPVDTGGLIGVGVLAQGLEDARIVLRDKLERLAITQARLTQRLGEAELGIDEAARLRREWFAENTRRIALSLGAGRVSDYSATLVDLAARGLIVRVPVDAPVDLPRGSSLRFSLCIDEHDDPTQARGSVKQRDVVDGEVELRVGVDFSRVLGALPQSVRLAIGPRQALRVRPANEQSLRLVIRGRSEGAAVEAAVTDVSVNGAGVRVELSEARVAAWGRVVRIGLAHSAEPGMVSSYAEIVRVYAGEDGVVLGLSFQDPDRAFMRCIKAVVKEAERLDLARVIS